MLARRYRLAALLVVGVLFGPGGPASAQTQVTESQGEPPSPETVRLLNGIRLIQLRRTAPSPLDGSIDIAFGYTVGLRDEGAYTTGVSSILDTYLAVSVPARTVALATHFAGGQVDFVGEFDLVGMRVRVPSSAAEVVLMEIADYFAQDLEVDTLEYARALALEKARVDPEDFRNEIGDEVRRTLFVDHPYQRRPLGLEDDIDRVGVAQLRALYAGSFGTDRAFVISSDPLPGAAVEALAAVKPRASRNTDVAAAATVRDTSVLEFPSRPVGGVILATATPSVHFRDWYAMLLLDGLIRSAVSPDAVLDFGLALDPFFHQVALEVEIPQYVEDVRGDLLESVGQLQHRPASPDLLNSLKSRALGFLTRRTTEEWFAAHDLWDALDEGRTVARDLTADELRSAARDFLSARRVIAIWAPAFTEPIVEVESLSDTSQPQPVSDTAIQRAPGRVDAPMLAPTALPVPNPVRVEGLESGITLAAAEQYGVFVAGGFHEDLPGGRASVGSNGVAWSFEGSPAADVFETLRGVRPDRILVFVPETAMGSERRRFADWTSGRTDSTRSMPAGSVATGDIPGLLTLKMWLDGKLIEAGWRQQVQLRIDGVEGSRLLIETDVERETQVREWIREVAEDGISEAEFAGARTAAIGYFDRIRSDLQILLWQRDPRGSIRSPASVTLSRLRTVARIYF